MNTSHSSEMTLSQSLLQSESNRLIFDESTINDQNVSNLEPNLDRSFLPIETLKKHIIGRELSKELPLFELHYTPDVVSYSYRWFNSDHDLKEFFESILHHMELLFFLCEVERREEGLLPTQLPLMVRVLEPSRLRGNNSQRYLCYPIDRWARRNHPSQTL